MRNFLSDPQTQDLLLNALDPYSSANSKTKSSFETKTSAVNATTSSRAPYDIAEIKEDSLWLSKTTGIDEVSALRIVVLEWQKRPAARLLRQGLRDIAVNPIQSLVLNERNSTLQKPAWPGSNIQTSQNGGKVSRQKDHLRIYQIERRFLLKVNEYLMSSYLCNTASQNENNTRADTTPERSWLLELGRRLFSAWKINGADVDKMNDQGFMTIIVSALQLRIQRWSNGCSWSSDENITEEVETLWAETQVLEMIHILQIAVILLQTPGRKIDSGSVVSWFRFMLDISFFEGMRDALDSFQEPYDLPLQSLCVLASLALLDISSTLELLFEASKSGLLATEKTDGWQFALAPAIMSEINDILINLASLKVTSPITLAWSIITQSVRELASVAKESKETRQALRAADRYGAAPDSSDTDGGERSINRSPPSLRRRSSAGSDTSLQVTLVEETYDAISVTAVDGDPINYLALSAVHNDNVFDTIATIAGGFCTLYGFKHGGRSGEKMRNILLDLIRCSVDFIQYQPSLVNATMAVLTGSERFWEVFDRPVDSYDDKPSDLFIQDPLLRLKILVRATSRYPYESMPFIQLSRAMCFQYTNSNGEMSRPWVNLEELDTFTCKLPDNFEGLKPIREDEETVYTELTRDLRLTVGSKETDLLALVQSSSMSFRYSSRGTLPSPSVTIPAGTTGVIQSETKPWVVSWNHTYHPLGYIGKYLQGAVIMNGAASSSGQTGSSDLLFEIVSLLSTLLISAIKDPWADDVVSKVLDSAQSILGQASDELSQNQDVVSIVLQLFENELYNSQQTALEDNAISSLARTTEFMFVLLKLLPDRVWPFLGRSGLLGIGQDEPQFGYVVSQETNLGRYEFLLACVRLYAALIEDAVSHAVSRKAPQKTLVRFGTIDSSGSGVSVVTMQSVLLQFSRCMVDVLESSLNWKFVVPWHRMEINALVCSAFERILVSFYGTGAEKPSTQKLTVMLAPAANYIVATFLSTSNSDLIVNPILNLLSAGLQTRSTPLPTTLEHFLPQQTTSAIELATALLKVNTLLDKQSPQLEDALFRYAGVVTRLYTVHQSYRSPTVRLMNAMLRSAARGTKQPPSLLGHLGQEDSHNFLEILSELDAPLYDKSLSKEIWELLATVTSQQQQWFAMYVLTGNTPKKSLQEKPDSSQEKMKRREAILNIALECLSTIEDLEPRSSLAMLDFVATSADYWPWVFTSIDNHPRFLTSISEFAARTSSTSQTNMEWLRESVPEYIRTQMTARIARILAMYTRYTQQIGNPKFARGLVPHLNHMINNAITTPSYNFSLHSNLRRNFEEKFPACDMTDFKRTTLNRSELGNLFYYDMAFADHVLDYNPAWHGKKGQGFAEEFRRANENLSLVEAQIVSRSVTTTYHGLIICTQELFSSWKSLLLELSRPLAIEPRFQKIMALAVIDCLQNNTENALPQSIFERLSSSRADLAFTLLQQLVEVHSTEPEARKILDVAWDAVKTHGIDAESVLRNGDANYYRLLQRILYLALQLHTGDSTSISQTMAQGKSGKDSASQTSRDSSQHLHTIYEVLSKGIAEGFRSLTTLFHTSPNVAAPADIAILTAMLSSCLQIPGLEQDSTKLLNAFSDSQTARCAATLLSWSDRLAATTSNEPILGELSVQFLVEMSYETSLAESLAVDGVVTQILSTNVIRVLQSRAFKPFDMPRRMFAIWSSGILPLLLNLLNSIGPPIAAEITTALNLFPHQLERASTAFAANSRTAATSHAYITFSMAVEAHNLALILSILNTFREAGASAAILSSEIGEVKWDANQVRDDIEGWLRDRPSLRERIQPTNPKEETWTHRKALKKDSLSVNLLEERIIEELGGAVGILAAPSEG